jgi:hypothetical protein
MIANVYENFENVFENALITLFFFKATMWVIKRQDRVGLSKKFSS